jgi:hypothetical protein
MELNVYVQSKFDTQPLGVQCKLLQIGFWQVIKDLRYLDSIMNFVASPLYNPSTSLHEPIVAVEDGKCKFYWNWQVGGRERQLTVTFHAVECVVVHYRECSSDRNLNCFGSLHNGDVFIGAKILQAFAFAGEYQQVED